MSNIFIYGAGGLGKEVVDLVSHLKHYSHIYFLDSNENLIGTKIAGIEVKDPVYFNPSEGKMVIAIADVEIRRALVKSLPAETQFATLIHPSASLGRNVSIGRGSIVSAGVVISCDSTIGEFAQINFNCTVGHDCKVGNYCTAAPGVNVSGNVYIGNGVYCGTSAAIKQGISIADKTVIGMSSSVIKDIEETGVTVFGNPARVVIKSKNQ